MPIIRTDNPALTEGFEQAPNGFYYKPDATGSGETALWVGKHCHATFHIVPDNNAIEPAKRTTSRVTSFDPRPGQPDFLAIQRDFDENKKSLPPVYFKNGIQTSQRDFWWTKHRSELRQMFGYQEFLTPRMIRRVINLIRQPNDKVSQFDHPELPHPHNKNKPKGAVA